MKKIPIAKPLRRPTLVGGRPHIPSFTQMPVPRADGRRGSVRAPVSPLVGECGSGRQQDADAATVLGSKLVRGGVGRRMTMIRGPGASTSRPQKVSLSLVPQDFAVLTQTIVVKLMSNWGDPEMIGAAEVDFMTTDRLKIDVLNVTARPRDVTSGTLWKLCDGNLMKTEYDECWTTTLQEGRVIELVFVLDGTFPVKSIRVFNGSALGKAAVKDAEIWCNDVFLWKGEITEDFGIVAAVDLVKLGVDTTKKAPYLQISDAWGVMPQIPTSQMSIELMSNYDDGDIYGLSGIEMWETNRKKVPQSALSVFNITHAEQASSANTLFRGLYTSPDVDVMWVLRKSANAENNPLITMTFVQPIFLGRIRFWNICGRNYKYTWGCKHIRIRIDGRVVWTGILNQGEGGPDTIKNSVTKIALNDMDDAVKKSVY